MSHLFVRLHDLSVTFVLLFVISCAASASSIAPGFDIFTTPNGTASIAVPGVGAVVLNSNPIDSQLWNTDTIVQRKQGIDFDPHPGGSGTIEIELVALSLRSAAPVDIGGSFFDVFVTIDALGLPTIPQPDVLTPSIGTMTINHEFDNGGTFTAEFPSVAVNVILQQVGNPSNMFSLVVEDSLTTAVPALWSHFPPGFALPPGAAAFFDDDDWHGNFIPGADPLTGQASPVVHDGPHPEVVAPTPEPSTLLLLGSSLVMVALLSRRKRLASK